MDIVTRLKSFMTALNIANSQFADTCHIPRPTISQILNGRNKKISDELIGKIHDAYPQLSVMWLMFGEGDMLINSNIQISEPKIGDNVSFDNAQSAVDETIMGRFDFDSPVIEKQQDNLSMKNVVQKAEYRESAQVSVNKRVETPSPMSISANPSKQVIEIRVFYNDNSYEIFVPQKNA